VSSAEENKALVRRFVEAQANADLDTLATPSTIRQPTATI
jgi:hypothetical protein